MMMGLLNADDHTIPTKHKSSLRSTMHSSRLFVVLLVVAHHTAGSWAFSSPAFQPARPTAQTSSRSRARSSQLLSTAENIHSSDPFRVLGLEPHAFFDKKEIKRAYKLMALKYHPDMVTTTSSSAAVKKAASDLFAKVNWAYEAAVSGTHQPAAAASAAAGPTPYNGARQQAPNNQGVNGGNGRYKWEPPSRQGQDAYGSSSGRQSGSDRDFRDCAPNYSAASGSKRDFRDYSHRNSYGAEQQQQQRPPPAQPSTRIWEPMGESFYKDPPQQQHHQHTNDFVNRDPFPPFSTDPPNPHGGPEPMRETWEDPLHQQDANFRDFRSNSGAPCDEWMRDTVPNYSTTPEPVNAEPAKSNARTEYVPPSPTQQQQPSTRKWDGEVPHQRSSTSSAPKYDYAAEEAKYDAASASFESVFSSYAAASSSSQEDDGVDVFRGFVEFIGTNSDGVPNHGKSPYYTANSRF